MSFQSYFPTFVSQTSLRASDLPKGMTLKRWNAELARQAYAFKDLDDAGQKWSCKNYVEGYTSYSSISDLPKRSSTFERLKKAIDKRVFAFAKHLEMDLSGGKLEMSACWLNIMGPACHHSFHLHPLSAISGTYYVNVPKNAGVFKIEDPRLDGFMASPPRKSNAKIENRRHISLEPVAGDILLFESWLRHEVPANRGHSDRISVSFNYDWYRS